MLTQQLQPGYLQLHDESHLHAGHAGARPEGQTHYRVIVESESFKGMAKVRRHQVIYTLLADEFKTGLHALSIDAYAPGERAL